MGMCTQAKYFEDEIRLPDLKHNKAGLLCMASAGENLNTSQFYITMRGEDMEVGRGGFQLGHVGSRWTVLLHHDDSVQFSRCVAPVVCSHSQLSLHVNGWLGRGSLGMALTEGARHAFIRVCGIQHLDGKHTIFGEVAEDEEETLRKINELYCDTDGRPYR